MNIYEIDAAIASLVDTETGEVRDYDYFEQLQIEREAKIENAALLYKNLKAEAEAIKAEEKALAERRKRAEANAERVKGYVESALNGEKYKTAKVAVSYRKSTFVEIEDGFIGWAAHNHDSLLRYAAPEPNKSAIAQYLTDGGECPYAQIIERNNMSIR